MAGMVGDVEATIRKIETNGWIRVLRQCRCLRERYDKLMELLPEIWLWEPLSARQLVLHLQRKHSRLEFGVCPHFDMRDDAGRVIQVCNTEGEEVECLCAIPIAYCAWRGKDGKPRFSEFALHQLLGFSEQAKAALELLLRLQSGATE